MIYITLQSIVIDLEMFISIQVSIDDFTILSYIF